MIIKANIYFAVSTLLYSTHQLKLSSTFYVQPLPENASYVPYSAEWSVNVCDVSIVQTTTVRWAVQIMPE